MVGGGGVVVDGALAAGTHGDDARLASGPRRAVGFSALLCPVSAGQELCGALVLGVAGQLEGEDARGPGVLGRSPLVLQPAHGLLVAVMRPPLRLNLGHPVLYAQCILIILCGAHVPLAKVLQAPVEPLLV